MRLACWTPYAATTSTDMPSATTGLPGRSHRPKQRSAGRLYRFSGLPTQLDVVELDSQPRRPSRLAFPNSRTGERICRDGDPLTSTPARREAAAHGCPRAATDMGSFGEASRVHRCGRPLRGDLRRVRVPSHDRVLRVVAHLTALAEAARWRQWRHEPGGGLPQRAAAANPLTVRSDVRMRTRRSRRDRHSELIALMHQRRGVTCGDVAREGSVPLASRETAERD
jgi:hypothetical protein